jgi:hypothetical protein
LTGEQVVFGVIAMAPTPQSVKHHERKRCAQHYPIDGSHDASLFGCLSRCFRKFRIRSGPSGHERTMIDNFGSTRDIGPHPNVSVFGEELIVYVTRAGLHVMNAFAMKPNLADLPPRNATKIACTSRRQLHN